MTNDAVSDHSMKLRDGNSMPRVSFGCYQSVDAGESVAKALQTGYRSIDTARVYKNEALVGQAVQNAISQGIPREQIFVTSKVNARNHSLKETPKAVRQSRNRIGLAHIDLYLLHDAISGTQRRLEAWSALIDAKRQGIVKNIGVSNWNVKHVQELLQEGYEVPAVNQIELHPFCQQRDIVAFCRDKGIILQAYSPLVRGARWEDATLSSIAERTGRTKAQVLLRWSIQKGFCPVVKSDTPARIEENFDIFSFALSEHDMDLLDALDEGKEGACSWNPVDCA